MHFGLPSATRITPTPPALWPAVGARLTGTGRQRTQPFHPLPLLDFRITVVLCSPLPERALFKPRLADLHQTLTLLILESLPSSVNRGCLAQPAAILRM